VYGSPDGEDLQVLAGQLGLLGFAPSARAREIIRALNQKGGGSLSGNVVSKSGTDVSVEICLK
jgi:hypothetical protein